MKLFDKGAKFIQSIANMKQFDSFNKPEVVFAGRSNAGKSSLINSLVKQQNLAHASKKPGKTKTFNIFEVGNKINLIDMPGYGYAFVSKQERDDWFKLIIEYFNTNRPQLKQVYFLLDSRVGLKDADIDMILLAAKHSATKISVIMTKCDKLNESELEAQANQISDNLSEHRLYVQKVFFTSAKSGYGMDMLRSEIDKVTI